jgi:hypothetical protein
MSEVTSVSNHRPSATDAMYDTSPPAMLERFAAKTVRALRSGHQACGWARLAASYAFLVHPEWRCPDDRPCFADQLFRLGQSLVRAQVASDQVH